MNILRPALKIPTLLLWCLALTGCPSNTTEENTSPDPVLDSLQGDIPDEIRSLDNLTVFPSLDAPRYDIVFHEEETFASPNEHSFGRHDEIAVDDAERVFVQEGTEIFVFDSGGNHIATMGGSGRGPGEHSGFGEKEMHIQGDRLFTYDNQLHRINIFSLATLEPIDTIVMDPGDFADGGTTRGMYPGNYSLKTSLYYPSGDSLLLVRFNGPMGVRNNLQPNEDRLVTHSIPTNFFLMDREGDVVSESVIELDFQLLSSGSLSGFAPLPVQNRTLMTLTGRGHILTASSSDFLIRIHNPEGIYQRAIFYPFERIPLDQKSFLAYYMNSPESRQSLANSDLPDAWPVMGKLMADDENRIWIPTYTGDHNLFRWYLLESDGSLLATFDWPAMAQIRYRYTDKFGVRAIKNGHLYAYEETPGDGTTLPQGRFVRYRFELTENSTEN